MPASHRKPRRFGSDFFDPGEISGIRQTTAWLTVKQDQSQGLSR
jgi:hypothetical protein